MVQIKVFWLIARLMIAVSFHADLFPWSWQTWSMEESKVGLNTYDFQDNMGFGFNVPGDQAWTNEIGPDGYPNKIEFEGTDTVVLAEVRFRDSQSDGFGADWEATAANLENLAEQNLGDELLDFQALETDSEFPDLYGYYYTCERAGTKLYFSVFYRFGQDYTAEFVGIDTDQSRGYRKTEETAKSFAELGGEAKMIGYRPPMLGADKWDYPYLHNPFAVTLYYLDYIAPTKERQKTDYVIQWKDDGVETLVRALLQKPEEDVMSSDLDHFTHLKIRRMPQQPEFYTIQANEMDEWVPSEGIDIHSIADVKEFKNLVSLDVLLEDLSDVTPIASMTGLKQLWLTCDNQIEDFEWLRPLRELELLDMWGIYSNIKDLDAMEDLKELARLRLTVPSVTDMSPLAGLPALEYLDLHAGDLKHLDQLTQVKQMFLPVPDDYDLSVFAKLPDLEKLYLYCSFDTDTSVVVDAEQIAHLVINGETIRQPDWEGSRYPDL